MGISLTKKELANLVGYSYRRLYDIDRGLPKEKKLFVEGDGEKFDLKTFIERWVDLKITEAAGKKMSLEDAKAVHEQVKIEKTRLEVARMQGELVDVNEVRRLWAGVAKTVSQSFLQLPWRLAEMVAGLENREIVCGILDREIRGVLEGIADTPLPEEAAGGSEEVEEEGEE